MDILIWISMIVILLAFSICNIKYGRKGREAVAIVGLIWLLALVFVRYVSLL